MRFVATLRHSSGLAIGLFDAGSVDDRGEVLRDLAAKLNRCGFRVRLTPYNRELYVSFHGQPAELQVELQVAEDITSGRGAGTISDELHRLNRAARTTRTGGRTKYT